jgi:hypothetical protein
MLAVGYGTPFTNKIIRTIMRNPGRIRSRSCDFIGPRTAELRAAIAAPKITRMIEIDLHITGHYIFTPAGIAYTVKCLSCPGFPRSIVPVAEFTLIFHVPTVLTFRWSLAR